MHSVIQHYTSSPSFTDELKTADGGVIVTVCDERFGCDEATRRTANFIKKNLPNLKFSTPQTLGGEVSFKFANYKTTKV